MKILSDPKMLSREFTRLMKSYNSYYWSIAWADFDFEHSNLLEKFSSRVKRISVGLTFYGTNVKFLRKFKSHAGVNFVTDISGTYHPKVYLFENSSTDYEILIGSANFTKSAFLKNTEFCILIKSSDKNAGNTYRQTIDFINKQWDKGEVIDETFISNYSRKKSKLKPAPSLSQEGAFKPIYCKRR
jgi:phosphatidylserine/phosphatidylglycerophosphate/cardiolipin synthase-like enzyme